MTIRTHSRRLGAMALASLSLAAVAAGPAAAAIPRISCPSASCSQVATNLGEVVYTAEDTQGNVYLTYQNGQLRKVALSSGQLTTVASGLGNLRGIALDGLGHAYVANFDGQLLKVDLGTGAGTVVFSGPVSLHAVAYSAGSVYVTTGSGVLWQVRDGQPARQLNNQVGYTDTIALDGKGNAYTGDMFGNLIQRTNLTTGAVQTVATTDYEMTSVSVGPDGRVYFALGSEVWRVDPATGQEKEIAELSGNIFSWTLGSDGVALVPGTTLYKVTGLTQL
jgi:sugar lactone lactonase YvrE